MYSRKALYCLPFLLFLVAGCGGNDISGPSNRIPDVAGNYRGTTTVAFPEISQTLTCTTTTSVTQSGSTVNIAPLQLSGTGDCSGVSIPAGPATIDATGSFGSASGSLIEDCGTYTYTASGGFFGRDLRMSLVYTSRTCLNMNITINLSRS